MLKVFQQIFSRSDETVGDIGEHVNRNSSEPAFFNLIAMELIHVSKPTMHCNTNVCKLTVYNNIMWEMRKGQKLEIRLYTNMVYGICLNVI